MTTDESKVTVKVKPGIGLDVGTMNIVSARMEGGKITFRRERDAFLDIPAEHAKRLRLGNKSVVQIDDEEVFLVGDDALITAQMMNREVRRPLKDGLISPGETDGMEVLGVILKKVLGEPSIENEACYFSIPAAPVDADRDIVYHKGIFTRLVEECGYEAVASNEAMAIIFSECAAENFSGIAISFGAGMCNIALSVNAIEGMSFSVARGGDYIDKGASKALGNTASNICAIKEKGVDIANPDPENRAHEAIAFYYKELIEYCLDNIAKEFRKKASNITLPSPIPIVVSGGTSKAGGFLDLFQKVFEKKRKRFPIEISEIRQAKDPLNAVAQGLMTQAILEHED